MVVHDRKICTKVRKETNNYFYDINILSKFDAPKSCGAIAQLVEHRTENPGVRGSIPRGTTSLNVSP